MGRSNCDLNENKASSVVHIEGVNCWRDPTLGSKIHIPKLKRHFFSVGVFLVLFIDVIREVLDATVDEMFL